MEYLRGNATASATGLFVICRYLCAFECGQTEEELRASLQVLRSMTAPQGESSAVLKASLTVGEGLGLISRDDSSAPWLIDAAIAKGLNIGGDSWPWFRGELLHRVGSTALEDIEKGLQPSDLALGLAWFLQLNPLQPPGTAWNAGPEGMVNELGFKAIARSEQWRPFLRWAIATGLARGFDHRDAKVLIPDPSNAIADQLPHLPKTAAAPEWLALLQARLPFLGMNVLLNQLPQGHEWRPLPASLVFGLLKLERRGLLKLESADDAVEVAPIRFGDHRRQLTRISVAVTR